MTKNRTQSDTRGPVLALDLGQKLVGIAVSDEMLITIKRLEPLKRSNWKKLLKDVIALIQRFDAQTLVIGLPLRLDGTSGAAAETTQQLGANFARSLKLPVYLQDERLTSVEAREVLLSNGHKPAEIPGLIDGEAAALILRDFLNSGEERILAPLSTRRLRGENK
jgi:putative Holliday junction resolvase